MRVERLFRAWPAWNVDGSSCDLLEWGSWIGLWEELTGQQRGRCAYQGCTRNAQHGGHVWLKRRGLCIVPICRQCNSSANTARMQQADGQHSKLRAGCSVVRLEPTAAILGAARRIAVRVCTNCERDLTGRPPNHTLCLRCYRRRF